MYIGLPIVNQPIFYFLVSFSFISATLTIIPLFKVGQKSPMSDHDCVRLIYDAHLFALQAFVTERVVRNDIIRPTLRWDIHHALTTLILILINVCCIMRAGALS